MQGFRFSLESVLNLQYRKRDQCLSTLSGINRRVLEIQRSIELIAEEQDSLRKYLGEHSRNAVVDVGLISRCHLHLVQLEYRRNQTAVELGKARTEQEYYRQELVKAEQKLKAIEKLKEKQLNAFRLRMEMRSRWEYEDQLTARLHRNSDS